MAGISLAVTAPPCEPQCARYTQGADTSVPRIPSDLTVRLPMLRLTIAFLAFALLPSSLSAQATTVFRGTPRVKISEGGNARTPEPVAPNRAPDLAVVISQIGDRYYWASRENVELVPIESGAFVTFVATNGAGYIRVIHPEAKSSAALMSSTEEQFDYVEHLIVGLRSITYYGTASSSSP